jgi:hypothetical protein
MTARLLVPLLFSLASLQTTPLRAQVPPQEPRSEETALLWSLGGTAVPIAAGVALVTSQQQGAGGFLIVTGVVIGPSLGHYYAGRPGRGLATIGLRAVVPVVTVLVMGAVCSRNGGSLFDQGCSQGSAGPGVALLGLGLEAASIIYDIASAPASARRYNRTHPRLTLAPSLRGHQLRLALTVHMSL